MLEEVIAQGEQPAVGDHPGRSRGNDHRGLLGGRRFRPQI
jgi:hypothetical protein